MAKFCTSCGAPLNEGQKFCTSCGAQIGAAQATQQAPQQTYPGAVEAKSKMAAGLLGIFLGSLGVHNFYLGYTSKAVTQLLLTLVGWILCGLGPIAAWIWGLIEGIMILKMLDYQFYRYFFSSEYLLV